LFAPINQNNGIKATFQGLSEKLIQGPQIIEIIRVRQSRCQRQIPWLGTKQKSHLELEPSMVCPDRIHSRNARRMDHHDWDANLCLWRSKL